VKLGKYDITGFAQQQLLDGSFLALAVLTWDDEGRVKAQAIHFCKAFATEMQAVHYAMQQARLRIQTGQL
jgi:hypothetical protein